MRICLFISAVLLGGMFSANKLLADWPQFRGPVGNGYLGKLTHPAQWSMKENLAWIQSIPGGGWSSPIIVGNRVFVTTTVDSKNTKPLGHAGGVRNMRGKKPTEPFDFQLICLSLQDGSVKWKISLAREQPKYAIHPSNTYATESPATDGKHVFCYFAAIGKVASVDLEGKLVWDVNLGAFQSGTGFGTGSSLTRRDGNLYIQCDNDKNSFVVALDAATGKEIWKRKRSSRTSWATPFIWKHGKRTDLVICGSG
ncbi:MAG: PQQ-binding-like beta-propeller repeat protein, partial [Anaerolineales bacterium]|nr:PQQ-binding-like beta-propeller repeat protein [Anaerolineales bacterium]